MDSSRLAQLLLASAIVVISALTSSAQASTSRGVWIDPELKPYFTQESISNKPVVVVALFEDKYSAPEGIRSRSYQASRVNMMRNAIESQRAAVAALGSAESMRSQHKQLWIVNGMLIRVPAKDVRSLDKLPGVVALYSNRKIHLISYRDEGAVSYRELADTQYTYGLQNLEIPQLRAKRPDLTGKGVLVGILDTGIDAEHPDLKGKVANWQDFTDGHKKQPYDDNMHGTHTSGTIVGGATSGTAIGIAPDASLVVGKIFDGGGSTTLDIILQAMQWIADPDGNPATKDAPRLVSNSWGGGAPSPDDDPAKDILCTAVDNWVKVGMLPVFANGNAGPGKSSVGVPGACPSALGVGATDKNDDITGFSSRGPAVWKTGSIVKPNLSAPGKDVISSVPGGKYRALSGTSMATPHAAGLATLLFQADPNLTAEQVASIMMKSAKDLGPNGMDNDSGAGRIDALHALAPALR